LVDGGLGAQQRVICGRVDCVQRTGMHRGA
jgi:hypothetical protein